MATSETSAVATETDPEVENENTEPLALAGTLRAVQEETSSNEEDESNSEDVSELSATEETTSTSSNEGDVEDGGEETSERLK